MTDRVRTELERLAGLLDMDRLIAMTRPDLAAELEEIANRYLDLSDRLARSGAGTRGQVEQKGVTVVRARPALVQP